MLHILGAQSKPSLKIEYVHFLEIKHLAAIRNLQVEATLTIQFKAKN